MTTKHYRDSEGNYLGGFDSPPNNVIEVSSMPKHAMAKWNGIKWVEPLITGNTISQEKLRAYFKKNNLWNFVKRVTQSDPMYVDSWLDKKDMHIDDQFMKVVSKGINLSREEIFAGAETTDIEDVLPSNTTEELEEAKNIAKALVNGERDRRKYLPVSYKDNEFSVSEWDMTVIMSLVVSSNNHKPLPLGDYWKTHSGDFVQLKKYDLNRLDDLIKEQIQASYGWSWIKKAQIDACTTVVEVEAVDLELTLE